MFTFFQGCQIWQSENACALQSWEKYYFSFRPTTRKAKKKKLFVCPFMTEIRRVGRSNFFFFKYYDVNSGCVSPSHKTQAKNKDMKQSHIVLEAASSLLAPSKATGHRWIASWYFLLQRPLQWLSKPLWTICAAYWVHATRQEFHVFRHPVTAHWAN